MSQQDERERHPLTRIERLQRRAKKAQQSDDTQALAQVVLGVLDLLEDAYKAGPVQRS